MEELSPLEKASKANREQKDLSSLERITESIKDAIKHGEPAKKLDDNQDEDRKQN